MLTLFFSIDKQTKPVVVQHAAEGWKRMAEGEELQEEVNYKVPLRGGDRGGLIRIY
jgi:hypothetical protein